MRLMFFSAFNGFLDFEFFVGCNFLDFESSLNDILTLDSYTDDILSNLLNISLNCKGETLLVPKKVIVPHLTDF